MAADATHPILTVGYEGATVEHVLASLRDAGTRTLIDVRDRPVSRKPGFSQRALQAAVEETGVAYVHLAELGTPKAGREAARAGRRHDFVRIMEARLGSAEGEKALGVAALLARTEGPVCLLCLEGDPQRCHRSIIAARLAARLGAEVKHLYAAPSLR